MIGEAHVLVVDDNEDNRYALVRRLRREGYNRLAEASNGREALDRIAGNRFDLVLLDVMMPELDGFAVLERLKSDAELSQIPVIMISALSEMDGVVRCIKLGAEDYLPKPFNATLLKARISASLERKTLRDRERAHFVEIDKARRRADELLHAILPHSAVEELRDSERVRPRRFDGVTVLFGDIVGFTTYCEANQAEEVVANLNLLAHDFEDIVTAHGLEKIKMIGDAFIATANLLEPLHDPVMAAIRAAKEITEAAEANPAGWQIRIGIHTGPVVAGIVGRTKFTFDLWGDTVNTASRISGIGTNTAILLSENSWSEVAARVDADPLGHVALRGRKEMQLYRFIR